MPLRLRRGTDQERLTITPASGELIYVTDTKRIFIGDGTTLGGIDIVTTAGGALTGDLNLNTNDLIGTGNISIIGSISNSVLTFDGSLLTSSDSFVSPVLGNNIGKLELGTGNNLVQIQRNWPDSNEPLETQYGISNGPTALITSKFVSRGTLLGPSILNPGDNISKDVFYGFDGLDYVESAAIWTGVDPGGTVSIGMVPGSIAFLTQGINGQNVSGFDSFGRFGINIYPQNAQAELHVVGNAIFSGDVNASAFRGSLFADDSTLLVDGITGTVSNGTISLVQSKIGTNFGVTSNLANFIGILELETNTRLSVRWSDPEEAYEERWGITDGFNSLKSAQYVSQGTLDNPLTLAPGDTISSEQFYGYDGTDFRLSSVIWKGADPLETISAGIVPGSVAFIMTTPEGNLATTWISSRGYIGIDTIPTEALTVNGNGEFSGIVTAAAYRGTFIGDDSSLIIDGATGTIYGNIVSNSFTVGGLEFANNTISVTDSTFINVNNDVTFNSDVNIRARVTANEFDSEAIGAPVFESATDITFSAGLAVVVQNAPFRLARFTTAERDALLPMNGDMIYNTTTNKFQGYENGAWVDLV